MTRLHYLHSERSEESGRGSGNAAFGKSLFRREVRKLCTSGGFDSDFKQVLGGPALFERHRRSMEQLRRKCLKVGPELGEDARLVGRKKPIVDAEDNFVRAEAHPALEARVLFKLGARLQLDAKYLPKSLRKTLGADDWLLAEILQAWSSLGIVDREDRLVAHQHRLRSLGNVRVIRHVDQQMVRHRVLLNPGMKDRHELAGARSGGGRVEEQLEGKLVRFHQTFKPVGSAPRTGVTVPPVPSPAGGFERLGIRR